ncbi:DUF3105 domain-containing protein [Pimelobacter simplex]|uniref:DUF3105 domain-containing protein n=1 Tax=Nocardioides simplex TaxID=2045 RepID=UPI00068C64BD|nr:DUF3105 domain-containing protein [Pimelobacter simplex]MCG8151481.1 DUF3105 domain-containing protein [Pimelobacter simplex]GEB13333.1 hypothetical protein NSI01_16480 [Pimelobacter simplex]SFM46271.1 Protein of unknown function [Pimelobacter simplex]
MSEPLFPPPPYPPPPPPFHPPVPPRRRARTGPVVLAVLAAVLVVGAAVLVPVLLTRDDDAPAASAGGDDDLSSVRSYDGLTFRHLAAGAEHDYPQSPPVGGDHAPVWIECGAYDEPLPEVNAVHDLEHGTTWITYRPDDVDAAGVRALTEALPDNGLLSPYPDQDAPVVVTVWGRQLALKGPDDPRLPLFVQEYGAGDTAPEPFASCNGGVDPGDLAPPGGPVV